MQFHHLELPNGLTVLAETNPAVHSVAVAVFVKTGVRDESPEVLGVSHFLEHMAFKGNDRYTAEDVNRILDEIGAESNASTGDEITQYYAVCLPEFLPTAFEVLSAIVFPSLRQEDFDTEKGVILEEIGMYQDQPGWVAYEQAMRTHFGGHPLGEPILGTSDSITALTADQMRTYHRERYRAGNMTLIVTGNASWDDIRRLAETHCAGWAEGTADRDTTRPDVCSGTEIVTRDGAYQEHAFQIGPGPAADDDLRGPASLVSCAIGDDSGSRLFWELVDPGRAEVADLSFNPADGYGMFMTYLCSRPEEMAGVLETARKIFDDVNENGLSAEELERARTKIAARTVLRSERPLGRLHSISGNWIYRGRYRSVEDRLAELRNISLDDVRNLLAQFPLQQMTTVLYGPLTEAEAPAATIET